MPMLTSTPKIKKKTEETSQYVLVLVQGGMLCGRGIQVVDDTVAFVVAEEAIQFQSMLSKSRMFFFLLLSFFSWCC